MSKHGLDCTNPPYVVPRKTAKQLHRFSRTSSRAMLLSPVAVVRVNGQVLCTCWRPAIQTMCPTGRQMVRFSDKSLSDQSWSSKTGHAGEAASGVLDREDWWMLSMGLQWLSDSISDSWHLLTHFFFYDLWLLWTAKMKKDCHKYHRERPCVCKPSHRSGNQPKEGTSVCQPTTYMQRTNLDAHVQTISSHYSIYSLVKTIRIPWKNAMITILK